MKTMIDKPPLEFLGLHEEFSSSSLAFAQSIRDYAEKEWRPHLAEWFESGSYPGDLMKQLGQLGILGGTIQGHGCPGLDVWSYAMAMRELERIDSGLRSFASVQSSLGMQSIDFYGSDSQKAKLLPKAAKGELVMAFGLTEADAGSDPSSMTTNISDDLVLNGSKRWLTNGGFADYFVIWAKYRESVVGILLDKERKGLSVSEIPHKLSLRISSSAEIQMKNIQLTKSDFLPGATSLGKALKTLNEARFGIIWGSLGAAEACFEEALSYSKNRKSFGVSIAKKQKVQTKLVQMFDKVLSSQSLAFHLCRLKEKGELIPAHVSMGKRSNVRRALDVARVAREILGANGVTGEYASMRHTCNLESVLTYEGTEDIHDLIVGQYLTGESAF